MHRGGGGVRAARIGLDPDRLPGQVELNAMCESAEAVVAFCNLFNRVFKSQERSSSAMLELEDGAWILPEEV